MQMPFDDTDNNLLQQQKGYQVIQIVKGINCITRQENTIFSNDFACACRQGHIVGTVIVVKQFVNTVIEILHQTMI